MEYRYIIIADNSDEIIYGECIEWELNEFDVKGMPPTTFQLNNKYQVYLLASDTKIDTIDTANNKISVPFVNKNFNKTLTLDFTDDYIDWVYLVDDESLFNPLIDYCCQFQFYTQKPAGKFSDFEWINNNGDFNNKCQERFNIDFGRYPELKNSFSYYKPTRFICECDFSKNDQSSSISENLIMKLDVLDEFNKYQSQTLVVNLWTEHGVLSTQHYVLPKPQIEFGVDDIPYTVEFILEESGVRVFHKKHGFIRSIGVVGNMSVGSVLLPNGQKQEVRKTMDFVVGETI